MTHITHPLAIPPGERTPEGPVNLSANGSTSGVRQPIQPCRECYGEGEISGYGTNDPGEKLKHVECLRCNGSGDEPIWKPNEDMMDEAENAFDNVHDMDVPVSAYCEAILIACRPLIIAEYEEIKNENK